MSFCLFVLFEVFQNQILEILVVKGLVLDVVLLLVKALGDTGGDYHMGLASNYETLLSELVQNPRGYIQMLLDAVDVIDVADVVAFSAAYASFIRFYTPIQFI